MYAITGALGFIGSNLARRMARFGHRLLLVDFPAPEKMAYLNDIPRFQLADPKDFLESLEAGRIRPEIIFHLGACSSTTETNWEYLKENNIGYSQALWRWCAREGKPLVYASSAATYGDGSLGFSDHIHPDELQPLNLYGKSKNDFDRWAFDQVAHQRPAPPKWIGVKFFNVYGPRERHKAGMASVIYKAFDEIRTTGRVRLFRSNHPDFADGEQKRDFVFVEDCIDHLLWLGHQPVPNGLYNSGTGVPRTFLDLARAVFAALDRPPIIEFVDMPPQLAKQYQNHTRAEMDKLRSTGYVRPPTPLEQGVARTVQFLSADSPIRAAG